MTSLALLSLCGFASCKETAPANGDDAAAPASNTSAPAGSSAASGATASANTAEPPPTGADAKSNAQAPKSNGLESGPARPELVQAARKIQKDLECLRGLKFKSDPKVAFQSLDDFRKYVDKQVKKELGGEKGERLVRMLHALDVVDPSVDVIAMLVEAAVGQAAAYYDPETDTFYVVQEMPAMMLNSVMAHELQHALQDQHTDLLDEYLDQGFGTTDQDLATRFIVEGEATLIGHTWLVNDTQAKLMGGGAGVCHLPDARSGDPQSFWPVMRGVVAEAAMQSRDDVLNPGLLTKLASNAMMSEGMEKSMKQLEALPVYFFYTLLLPYNQGGLTVYETFAQGGYDWAKVDALFSAPPKTSEQVLHPEKLRAGEGFASLSVPELAPIDTASAEGWSSDPLDRLGELTLRILLIEEGLSEKAAIDAAAGWNGDSIRVWHKGDLLAFDWALAFDSPGELRGLLEVLPGVIQTQRKSDQGAVVGLDALNPGAPEGALAFSWTDSQGRARHGKLSWAGKQLQWTDGWPSPVTAH